MDSNSQNPRPRPMREAPLDTPKQKENNEQITDEEKKTNTETEKSDNVINAEVATQTPEDEKTEADANESETPHTQEPIQETALQQTEPAPPKKKKNGSPGTLLILLLVPLIIIFAVGAAVFFNEHRGESAGLFTLGKGDMSEMKSYISDASREVRGVFIATVYNINYPSKSGLTSRQLKKELDDIISTCLENNLNAVYFQASPNSDALYDSDILPVSAVLSGTEGKQASDGFDPLSYLCDAAHEHNIDVHAWVNPMRVTGKNAERSSLSDDNPAKAHPEWTVEYDGAIYYNLGIPEVRALAASVCSELASKYEIDGIIFDDYFYPYPVDGQAFDDADTYKQFGKDYVTVGDFRRAAASDLVKRCHDAIKETDAECEFGIAPFGVWQNDDGSNGGSETKAFESYESLYCDTLDMIKSASLDYVAPQIYWQFSYEKAPYETLCDWWNRKVEGSGVKLIISHAAYKAQDWQSESEFTDQINYAREEKNYVGSIFYGYDAIYENDFSVAAQIRSCFETELVYTDYYPTGQAVELTKIERNGNTVSIEGKSDIGYPVLFENEPLCQKRDGTFLATLNTNEIVLTQNGREYTFSE